MSKFNNPVDEQNLLTPNEERGRIVFESKNHYLVDFSHGHTAKVTLAGRYRHEKFKKSDYPTVGDWVIVREHKVIVTVCPRQNLLCRQNVGKKGEVQALAANVDLVFVATDGLSDFNINRLQRFLAIGEIPGSQTIFLVTKADLLNQSSLKQIELQLQQHFPSIPRLFLRQDSFASHQQFLELFKATTTAVFLGSSGVGKSTIVNFLVGKEVQVTQSIRSAVPKGKHTTTSRNLLQTKLGGYVIDTPGLRAVGVCEVIAEDNQSNENGPVQSCRFRDCSHTHEPGCVLRDSSDSTHSHLANESQAFQFSRHRRSTRLHRLQWQRKKRMLTEAG